MEICQRCSRGFHVLLAQVAYDVLQQVLLMIAMPCAALPACLALHSSGICFFHGSHPNVAEVIHLASPSLWCTSGLETS